jgi:DNA-binding beta-propeller fold protein YncE
LKHVHIHLILLFILFSLIIPSRSLALKCINAKSLFDVSPGANQPSDIAIAPNGDMYLVDGVNNRGIVISKNGDWKFDFGKEGDGKGQFKHPLGIDISDKGKVFITDAANHRIQAFDLKGKFLYMFKLKTKTDTHPPDPADIIVSNLKEYLYISDNENHKIKVYKQNGDFQFEWGKFGEGLGEFRYPGIMSPNEFNEIFVVDVLNTRVQKFDPYGNFIASIGMWGVLEGKFFRPKGVAIDKKNRVFITDSYMGVIQAFTDMGSYIGVICEKDRKKVFNAPVGILIDKNDRLVIVEMSGNKITVLKILE